MKRRTWLIAAALAVGLTPLLLIGLWIGLGARPGARAAEPVEAVYGRPAVSPSRKYVLSVLQGRDQYGVEFQQFQVKGAGASTGPAFLPEERFRSRDTTYFLWDEQDRVWVYSGDVGTFYWERGRDGAWKKRPYRGGQARVPVLLRQRRGQFFK